MKKIVVLYTEPDKKVWKDLMKKKPSTVVINPADGPGPKSWTGRKQWITLINDLKKIGWEILYYIDVQSAVYKDGKWVLTRKTEKQLLEEATLYKLYPKADGYFLDDYQSTGKLYPEVLALEKVLTGLLVGNPGTPISSSLEKQSRCQVLCLHETTGLPKKKPSSSKKVYAIVFGESSDKKLVDQQWDYGIVYGNKESSNPFETLPINLT
jgi:hypothetical protein